MLDAIIASLNTWNATKTEREKLQDSYLFIIVVIILVAGVVTLFDAEFGHNIVKLAILALATFAINAIAWSLLKGSLLVRLSTKSKRK